LAYNCEVVVEGDLGICSSTVQVSIVHPPVRRGTQEYTASLSVITDFRPTNVTVDAWYVKYISIKGLSLVLTRCAIWWARDLMNACHNAVYGGCGRPFVTIVRWILSQSGESYCPLLSRIYGCTVWTCGGFCEKAMSGICLSGHVMRLASAQFGK